ncbi:oxidoreductase [Candidatus Sumerlaeota bacterium]|nr:oxidoreductase [Candidatus Sumerlaeota bacterium]
MYWAAACGGCEISILDIEEHLLDVDAAFDLAFFPCIADFKTKDVEAMPDKSITVCLFNGAIRNSENEYMAKLMRQKSVVLVAYGSCAAEGCIPGLANFYDKKSIFDFAYKESPSTVNPEGKVPVPRTQMPEGEIEIPEFWDTVKTLNQVVDVDYYIPGCPPQSDQAWAVIETVVDILQNGKELPPAGTVLGAGNKTCCDECPRERKEKKIKKFVRPYEIIPDPDTCLMEQGLVCCGPATRDGCGAKCVKAGIPCRGCYGVPAGVSDQGAKMVAALASVIDSEDPEEIERIIDGIVDPAGTFYRFSLAASTLRRVQLESLRPAAAASQEK